jgi:hypothetical protein
MTNRRDFLKTAVFSLAAAKLSASPKTMRGIFPIMQTPYAESGRLDTETLAKEVKFLDYLGKGGSPSNGASNIGIDSIVEFTDSGSTANLYIANNGGIAGSATVPPTTSWNARNPFKPSSPAMRRGWRMCTSQVCIQPLNQRVR